jgi:hypothetical protein
VEVFLTTQDDKSFILALQGMEGLTGSMRILLEDSCRLELQGLISSGTSTVPSRVNSAAYANAASIAWSVSAA